jgi:hypothetical protein
MYEEPEDSFRGLCRGPEKMDDRNVNCKKSLKDLWNEKSDHSIGLSLFIFLIPIFVVGMSMLTMGSAKPVIYLYPERRTDVTVTLDYNGRLEHTYPKYDNGWRVTAYPDGTLINHADGGEYSYLFWDGHSGMKFDFSSGFVVKGEDTAEFLREKLSYLGLIPKEYNEFIVYWLPLMEKNPYNLITFQGVAYTDNAVLNITPEPDSVLRVYMAFKPLFSLVSVPPQELETFKRRGFTVVEWGGSEVR